MKKLLILVLTTALLAPLQAAAHQPVPLLVSDTSAANGPLLVDGTVSFAIRASFKKTGEKRGFRVNLKSGDQLAIQYLILDRKPENTLKNSKLPKLVVTSPAGKKFRMKLNERTKFFEPYGKTDYLYLGRYKQPAEAGMYSFLLTSRGKSAVTIAIGELEIQGEVLRGETPTPTPTPTEFTLAQVAANNSSSACWSAISGYVYDLTSWIGSHPGGPSAILSLCGVDGTSYFLAQHRGQSKPTQRLSGFLLGPLKR
ncbi:MAG: cytochrome b5-like heme/steroid binding domain-containing protein [Candidatus Planktophila sp.]